MNDLAFAATDYSALVDGSVIRVPLASIKPFSLGGNIRKKRNDVKFADLRRDIRLNGVTQAVTVRPDPENPYGVELLAGYGRFEASEAEGLSDIPAVLKTSSDKQALAIMLSENLVREDLGIVDEAKAAQSQVSLHDGDYSEAAKVLGWTEAKVKSRIVLMQCCEEVLDELDEGRIKLGHAEILSQFTPKLQQGTLAKILSEDWTVAYLKERANKAQRYLAQAKFDTSECSSCPHNSDLQASLFDNSVGKAKCGDLTCYRTKTEAWLETRKQALKETYGVVLIAIEKPANERNTVGESIVGSEQYVACRGCEKNAAILQDGINADAGTVIENQCIDTDCFRQCSQAHQAAQAAPNTESAAIPLAKAGTKLTQAKAAKSCSKKTAVQKPPKSVTESYRNHLREVSAEHYLVKPEFFRAVTLAALAHVTGYKPTLEGWSPTFKDSVAAGLKHDATTMSDQITQAIRYYASESKDNSFQQTSSIVDLMICALKESDQRVELATKKWVPTKKILNNYTKGGIESLCRAAKFIQAYEADGKRSFAKLMAKGKPDLIKEILAFDFDWNSYAPAEMLNLIS